MKMDLNACLLYRDGLMLVINKPSGWSVHGDPRETKVLQPLFETLRFGFPRPPSLAHRLDRGTSGCLVLGRHPKALRRLGKLFADSLVEKRYWAVVQGRPSQDEGSVELAMEQKPGLDQDWTMEIHDSGKMAITHYRVLATQAGRSVLELQPVTGRTHQIRVHCQALGCPVLGDGRYGGEKWDGLCLHARMITLPLYPHREPVTVMAPPPPHWVLAASPVGFDPGG